MATWQQLPGTCDITMTAGDELNGLVLDFDRDLTGYTFTAAVYEVDIATSFAGEGISYVQGDTVATPTISVIDEDAGQIAVGLSETQTAALSPAQSYRWFVRWVSGGVTRTVVSGSFTVKAP